jgi:hypothetical protein
MVMALGMAALDLGMRAMAEPMVAVTVLDTVPPTVLDMVEETVPDMVATLEDTAVDMAGVLDSGIQATNT